VKRLPRIEPANTKNQAMQEADARKKQFKHMDPVVPKAIYSFCPAVM
jgi:hypothetical protein